MAMLRSKSRRCGNTFGWKARGGRGVKYSVFSIQYSVFSIQFQRSADWQSAVSPIGNRPSLWRTRNGLPARDTAECQSALYGIRIMRIGKIGNSLADFVLLEYSGAKLLITELLNY